MLEFEGRKWSLILTIAAICTSFLGIVAYFMPFVDVLVSLSYIEAVTEITDYIPILLSLVSFVCAIISIKAGSKLEIVTAITAAISLVFVVILMNEASDSLFISAADLAGAGYTVFVVSHLATVILALLVLFLPMMLGARGLEKSRKSDVIIPKRTKNCPHCERKVDADAEFCPYCGESTRKKPGVEPVIYEKSCAKCGAMMERGTKFCPNCGYNADANPGGFSTPTDLG